MAAFTVISGSPESVEYAAQKLGISKDDIYGYFSSIAVQADYGITGLDNAYSASSDEILEYLRQKR